MVRLQKQNLTQQMRGKCWQSASIRKP